MSLLEDVGEAYRRAWKQSPYSNVEIITGLLSDAIKMWINGRKKCKDEWVPPPSTIASYFGTDCVLFALRVAVLLSSKRAHTVHLYEYFLNGKHGCVAFQADGDATYVVVDSGARQAFLLPDDGAHTRIHNPSAHASPNTVGPVTVQQFA
ncbi:MAG: hypothetical protein M1823_006396 [Watsoniomyces obsoletus]|nr:MAG: hypothetical protein M1823_006396 [Watsoniomyces obsoletus]